MSELITKRLRSALSRYHMRFSKVVILLKQWVYYIAASRTGSVLQHTKIW